MTKGIQLLKHDTSTEEGQHGLLEEISDDAIAFWETLEPALRHQRTRDKAMIDLRVDRSVFASQFLTFGRDGVFAITKPIAAPYGPLGLLLQRAVTLLENHDLNLLTDVWKSLDDARARRKARNAELEEVKA
jgi:hypothetical protein